MALAGLACNSVLAADKKPPANERSVPLDRSGYFDPGATTTDDLRRVAMPADFNAVKTSFVIKNARLFDGTGAPARAATVVVVGNKISKVLPANATDFPKDAEVIDAAGATVMPGLIDMHIPHDIRVRPLGPPELDALV
jgi:hypothetical protein